MMDDHAAPPLSFYWLRLDETPTRPFPFGESGVTRSERSALRSLPHTRVHGSVRSATGDFSNDGRISLAASAEKAGVSGSAAANP